MSVSSVEHSQVTSKEQKLLPDEKGPHHLDQVVVMVIHLYLYIYSMNMKSYAEVYAHHESYYNFWTKKVTRLMS